MTQNSYDFSNPIRDVSLEFDTLIASSPSFLKLFGSLGQSMNPITGAPIVTNTKYEWINDPMTQYSSAITAFDTDGDGTGITLASTTGFEAGSIIRFEAAAGSSKTELAQVTSVDSATELTISRDYGSTTGVTLIVGDIVILNSTPRNEDSDVGYAIKHQSSIDFNYTEIFDEVANLSATAMASASYDNATAMAVQVRAAMIRLARKLENALIHGVRVQRTSSVAGSLGGLIQYISGAGGNIDATGGNLSQTLVNNVIEDILQDGGMLINPMILCAPNQARRFSALNTSGSNPTVFKENTDRTVGGYTTAFVGDLTLEDQGIVAKIFTGQNFPKDKVAIVDMNSVSLQTMRGLASKDATTNGTDGRKERILAEVTLEIKNATTGHGIITGLNI
jgi:hypothetical protein